MGFANSLKIGNAGQKIVTDILEKAGFSIELSVGKCVGWDIKAIKGDFQALIECKFDKYSEKSGNLAFEWYNSVSNKPSGIKATISDIWLQICSKNEILATSSKKLLKYCDTIKPFKTILNGGDGNAHLLIYKKQDVIGIFHRIESLPPPELEKILKELKEF